MSEYIWIFLWLGLMIALKSIRDLRKTELVCGKPALRYHMWFAVLAFAPVIWIAGNRGWVGDTWLYRILYYQMPRSIIAIPSYLATIQKDKGFTVLSIVIKFFAGNDSVAYFTVLAIMQGIAIIVIFRKYSVNYILSIFLFIASTDYVSWMMNGLRQFMAVTIIFAATGLMLKKKYIPLIIIILIASTMHRSALIMIPLVLVGQGKAWNKKTLVFIFMALLGIVFVGEFTNFLGDALQETQYKNVMSDAAMFNDNGTNPIRVAVYSVPAIVAFIGRKMIRKVDNTVINLCTNMSIISMGLYLMSMVTSGIFIGRLPIYVSLYSYILLPWELDYLFTKTTRKYVYMSVIGLYLIYYYYQMHMSWGMI